MVSLSNKKFTTCFIFLLTLICWGLAYPASARAPIVIVESPIVRNRDRVFADLIKDQYQKPIYVQIDSINVKARVEEVSINEDGSMGVPKNFNNVAWLNNSSRAGQIGNLVISGHYDFPGGSGAIFYNLANVSIGDTVYVTTLVNNEVENTKKYIIASKFLADPNNNDHIQEAYKDTKEPTITLITCNGVWDSVKHEYSHRVVVKGELVN